MGRDLRTESGPDSLSWKSLELHLLGFTVQQRVPSFSHGTVSALSSLSPVGTGPGLAFPVHQGNKLV